VGRDRFRLSFRTLNQAVLEPKRENRLYNERKERLYESKLKRMTHTAQ